MELSQKIMGWSGVYGLASFECYVNPYVSTDIDEWLEYYKEKYPSSYVFWIEEN